MARFIRGAVARLSLFGSPGQEPAPQIQATRNSPTRHRLPRGATRNPMKTIRVGRATRHSLVGGTSLIFPSQRRHSGDRTVSCDEEILGHPGAHFNRTPLRNGHDNRNVLEMKNYSFQSCVWRSRENREVRNSFRLSTDEKSWSEQPSAHPLICSTGTVASRNTGIPLRCAAVNSAHIPPLCTTSESQWQIT